MDADAGGEGHRAIVPESGGAGRGGLPAYIGSTMSDATTGEAFVLAPPVRNYSPWYQWMARLAATTHEDPLPEADPEAMADWLAGRRRRLAELLGPEPEAVPLNFEVLESTACDGYRRDKVVFDSEDTMSVPAYLLVPDHRASSGEPGAAVLACHGHGPGKGQAVGLEHTAMPNADYALQLAQRGYVVLAPDLRCFGERQDWNPEDHYACDTNLVHAAMAGWNPLAQNVWDLRRCLDVLADHPLVDARRLGMVGISYGGTVTLFTAAVDDRVAAAVVSGYFSSWAESHKMPWNMCGSQILFGMLGQLEHEDLGALVAPRPFLVETGTEDYLFPVAAATEAVRRTRFAYDSFGAGERLVHDVFDGDHQWHGTEALPFLDRWLGHRPAG
jgi:dienelactone hydrolase